jgi:hypothetical protein
MTHCADFATLLICFGIPLCGVIGSILILSGEQPILTQCIIMNKNYSELLIAGEYASGAQGSTSSCDLTINYRIFYEIFLPDYNFSTTLCGLENSKINCCTKDGCCLIIKKSAEFCPLYIESDLTLYNKTNIGQEMKCWLLEQLKVVKLEEDTHYIGSIVLLVVCGLWLLTNIIFMLKDCYHRIIRLRHSREMFIELAEVFRE